MIAYALGIAMGLAYIFGTLLYKRFRDSTEEARDAFWKAVSERFDRTDLVQVTGEYREYEKLVLDRRNILWSLFAKVVLAILVVTFISLLISTCKIESQAGLPIISGIIAFIIGQGSDLISGAGSPVVYVPRGEPDNGQSAQGKKADGTTPKSDPGKPIA